MATKREISVLNFTYGVVRLRILNALIIVSMIVSIVTLPTTAVVHGKASAGISGKESTGQTDEAILPENTLNGDKPRNPNRPQVIQPQPRSETRPSSTPVLSPNLKTSNNSKKQSKTDLTGINKKIDFPLMFVENMGQYQADIRFIVGSGNSKVTILSDKIEISVAELISSQTPSNRPDNYRMLKLGLSFNGANPHPKIEGFDRSATRISYPDLKDPQKRIENVPAWGGIRYVDLYPGIDLEIASEDGEWTWTLVDESDTLVKNAVDIHLKVEGANALSSQEQGLDIAVGSQTIHLPRIQIKTPTRQFTPAWRNGNDLNGNEWSIWSREGQTSNIFSSGGYSLASYHLNLTGPDYVPFGTKSLAEELSFNNPLMVSPASFLSDSTGIILKDYSTLLADGLLNDMVVDSTGAVVFTTRYIHPDLGAYFDALAKLNPEGTQLEFINFYIPQFYTGTLSLDGSDHIYLNDDSLSKFNSDGTLVYSNIIEGMGVFKVALYPFRWVKTRSDK